MSVRIMTAVWAHGPETAADRLLLLAIADNANDEGQAWPSVGRLASKCCVEERAVRYGLRRLAEGGWIEIEEHAGRPNTYKIRPERLHSSAGLHSGAGLQPGAGEGGTPVQGPLHSSAAKPSTTVKEPSSPPKRRRAQTGPPDSFPLTEERIAWARTKGAPGLAWLESETEAFLLWHQSKDSRYADWHRAWQTWIRKALNGGPAGGRSRAPALDEFEQAVTDWLWMHPLPASPEIDALAESNPEEYRRRLEQATREHREAAEQAVRERMTR